MAWVNKCDQSLICDGLDTLMKNLREEAKVAAAEGDIRKMNRLADRLRAAEKLEGRMYSYAKDR